MEDRRYFKRVGYTNDVRLNIINDRGIGDVISHTLNISGGGMSIAAHAALRHQQPITFEISVPGYFKSIMARGEVVWANEREQVGIRFTNIDSYDRQMILDYIHFS